MNLLAGVTLLAVAWAAWRVGRSVLYPPAMFALVWGVALVWLAAASYYFYPIADITRLVFVVGALAFAAGGVAVTAVAHRVPWPVHGRVVHERALDVLFILLAAGLWPFMQRLGPVGDNLAAFLTRVRLDQLAAGLIGRRADLVDNLVPLSIIFTLVAFSQDQPTRWARVRGGLMLLIALFYQVLTGARGGAVMLLLSVGALVWLREGRLTVRRVAVLGSLFLLIFGGIGIALNKGAAKADLPLRENIVPVLEGLQQYALAGLVAFDNVLRDPHLIPGTGGVLRTVNEFLNRLGADIPVPSLHAQYVAVADGRHINVFTAYWVYFLDGGLLGTVLLCAAAGAAVTAAYFAARAGSLLARPVFGILFAGMAQTVFNEPFYTNFNILAKTVIVTLALHWVAGLRVRAAPPRLEEAIRGAT